VIYYIKEFIINFIHMLKNPSTMSIENVAKYIIKEFHNPTRKLIEKLRIVITDLNEEDTKAYPKLKFLWELFIQFKSEYLKHMENEEITTFPTIIKYEKILNNKNISLLQWDKQYLNYVEMKNEHESFNSYLVSIISLFDWLDLNKKINNLYNIFIEIQNNNLEHAELENNIIYPKWIEFQDKLLWKS